jgi:pyruvate/2-oxoglutarate dehydrogenase complex dihydrolipoamide acyltransferase (E2) component
MTHREHHVPDDCWVLRAPRLNANDDSVTLTRWLVADRSAVAAGAPLAEIETEKATTEVAAGIGGVLLHAVATGDAAPVGAPLAYVGATLAAAEAARDAHAPSHAVDPARRPAATAKAQALAAARGVDIRQVRPSGDTVKERDVARHLGALGATAGAAPDPRLVLAGKTSPHQLRVARDLRAASRAGLFTTLAFRLDLRGPERTIASELAQGRAASLLAPLLHALGRTLPDFPALLGVRDGEILYRYRDIDIAFAVRSPAGDLHAPVVRHVDRRDLADIARECARLAKSAMRGKLDARDVSGACLAVSLIAIANVESFVALPMPLQAAILAVGATRQEIALTAAGPVARPVATATVTYDHALCDGAYVAEFCAALDRALNPEPA